jgi:rhamnulokinase
MNGRTRQTTNYLAFDIGAESGRAFLGNIKKDRLTIQETCRFSNGMIIRNGHLHWDIFHLYEEIKKGIIKSSIECGSRIESIGIDTWGVDFGLLDRKGDLISPPFAYRDKRNELAMQKYLKKMPEKQIYQLTGVQFMQFNSIFQLYALKTQNPELLEQTQKLLFMPDLFNYFLTGHTKTEFTIATTSQLYDPVKQDWADDIFINLGVPKSIMQDVVPPGTKLGKVKKSIQKEAGISELPVIAVATHDTGAAVAAVPGRGKDWAFISSGTWSILGTESNVPIITEQAYKMNFTNEGGINNTFRLSKNIMGLWLLQKCRRAWWKEKKYKYEDLVHLAEQAKPFRYFIDPDWSPFLNPPDMPETLKKFCRITGQPVPETHAEITRCIFEGLALKYRYVLDELKTVYPGPIRKIHIIGGGAKNHMLCRFTANATGLPVFAGPYEATIIGNIMVQALGRGTIRSVGEMREIISRSVEIKEYFPNDKETWDKAYNRFCQIAMRLNNRQNMPNQEN